MTQRSTQSLPEFREVTQKAIGELRSLSIRALRRMYLPEQGLFAYRFRRDSAGDRLEGVSRRYSAIVLIALAGEPEEISSEILAGQNIQDVCSRLLLSVRQSSDIGEVALTLWAARAMHHPHAWMALDRLKSLAPSERPYPTVEVSWALTALVVEGEDMVVESLADQLAKRLLGAFQEDSDLFPHWPAGAAPSSLRAHVACFADLVYPIVALASYYRATYNTDALHVARCCAQRMCELQGAQGQWWWHYDVRTGQVVERFPIYAVHQDAMGPMALFALQEVSGEDYAPAIVRSLRWLIDPPEIPGSLIDAQAGVIWRKVARHEPGKLARSLQAGASRLHPALRVPGLDVALRPGHIDHECRPYHLGWILYAWPADRMVRVGGHAGESQHHAAALANS